MRKDDIMKVVRIMEQADSGCEYCSRSLVHQLAKQFPEHKEIIISEFIYEWEENN